MEKETETVKIRHDMNSLWYEQDKALIDKYLKSFAPGYSNQIRQLVQGLFESGGKRVRPLLTAAVIRCLGGDPAENIELVSMSEIVHTATLIHDDIVDDTDSRRGRPSAHIAFDPKTAVLSGDYLLAQAMLVITRSGHTALLDMAASAISDLVEGEVVETEYGFSADIPYATVRRIQMMKTASLFAYATKAGALLAGAGGSVIDQAGVFGTCIGTAFQTVDDLLDWTGDYAEMGKPIGHDLLEGKITVPTAIGMSQDPEIKALIENFWADKVQGTIIEIKNRLEKCDAFALADQNAKDDVAKAKTALIDWPDSEYRSYLFNLADRMADRNS